MYKLSVVTPNGKVFEGEVDSDSSFSFVLQLVEDPGVLERVSRTSLFGLLCELVNHPLVYDPEVKEHVAHGGGLSVVHMAADDKVQVRFVSHAVSRITNLRPSLSIFKRSAEISTS